MELADLTCFRLGPTRDIFRLPSDSPVFSLAVFIPTLSLSFAKRKALRRDVPFFILLVLILEIKLSSLSVTKNINQSSRRDWVLGNPWARECHASLNSNQSAADFRNDQNQVKSTRNISIHRYSIHKCSNSGATHPASVAF